MYLTDPGGFQRDCAVWVDTNGSLYFNDPTASRRTCAAIPDVEGPNTAIMPFCDDLMVAEGNIKTAVVGIAPNRTFVVEWSNVSRWGHDWWEAEPHFLSFQVRLGEDGTITFNYKDIDSAFEEERGSEATIGIENQSGTSGVQHGRFEQVLATDLAVKLMPQYGQLTSTGGAGQAGTFAFANGGVSDVTAYLYGLDTNPPTTVTTAGSVSATPATDGPHILYVRSQDRAGNLSPVSSYRFYAGPGGLTSPQPNDVTASKVELAAEGHPASTAVTYQWRRADTDAWSHIPLSHVIHSVGSTAVASWPMVTPGNGVYPRLVWDVAATLGAADAQSIPRDGPLQVRAIFSGLSNGEAKPVKITFDRNRASAASEQVGPGSVNMVTGNFTVGASEVSIGGLGLTRSYNSRRTDEPDPMFGPGWVSSIMAGGSPYTSVNLFGSLLQVGLPDGKTLGFTATGSGTTFEPGPDAAGLTVLYSSSQDRYTLTDQAGNTVVFGRSAGDPAGEYRPIVVSSAGSGEIATVSWEKVVVDGVEVTRPTRLLGPVPTGVSCTTMTRGCRSLAFTYGAGRLQSIDHTAWDPATSAMLTRTVAAYAYDGNGRLQAAWDPRLSWTDEVTHHVKTQYTYQTDGVLSTIIPPGEEPWTLHYTTTSTDLGKGRLHKVVRSALSAGTATATVVYDVPVSGSGAPYDLSVSQTGRWGQVVPPVQATALFPPTQIPNGSSYERATVSYLDANGRVVNTIQPGGNTSTVWYDARGNIERELTAGNRKRALDQSLTDTAHQELVQALNLSTYNGYSGNELSYTLEPEHEMLLSNGAVVLGRKHTSYTYQNGLVVSTTVQARWWDNAGVTHDADARVTATEYDPDSKLPVKSIVDPGGLTLTTRTAYDSKGRVVQTTTPGGGASDTTPSTQETVYYSSGAADPQCGSRPEWDGMVCLTQPGGQPAGGPELPSTRTEYDYYGNVTTKVESTSTGVARTTTTTYDLAGRDATLSITSPVPGEPLEVRRNTYDQSTGALLKTQTLDGSGNVTAEILRSYDDLGRPTSYSDANGNLSTVTYDIMSRPVAVNDGKATRTHVYDGGSERRGLATSVTDSELGQLTGTYDADGQLTTQAWPNGVQVTMTFDEVGQASGLSYVKGSTTLYHDSARFGPHGQSLRRTSMLSNQSYAYNGAGSLVQVADNSSGSCTTRVYSFDTSSNRTGVTTYGPDSFGACQSTTSSTATVWAYDSADRSTNTGYSYDAMGRTLAMPASDTAIAGGGQTTMTYHVNDMVRSITQGTRTATYTLDVIANRFRSWADNQSGTPVTKVNHFSSDSDTPVWTDEAGGTWSRQIAGVGGVVAMHTPTAGERYQVANLRGDLVAAINELCTGIEFAGEFNENGQPRNPSDTGAKRYGWLGASQRASDNPGGIVLMGARLYAPGSGRFLSTDPIYGGSANPYEYCNGDPVGCTDVSGLATVPLWLIVSCSANSWLSNRGYRTSTTYNNWYGSAYWKIYTQQWYGTLNFRCHIPHNVAYYGMGGGTLLFALMAILCSWTIVCAVIMGVFSFVLGMGALAYNDRCSRKNGFWAAATVNYRRGYSTFYWRWWAGGGSTRYYAAGASGSAHWPWCA